MLMLTQLDGFMAGGGPPELSFLQSAEDTANLTTYSFASQNIGADDVTRRIVVVGHISQAAAARTFVSATIGGIGATIHVAQAAGSALGGNVAIFSALVPTGTTATIAFTASGACDRASIAVYRAINETVATPHAPATDNTFTGGLLSTTINIPANGWVVSGSGVATGTGNAHTWVGVTEQYDAAYGDAAAVTRSGGFASGLPLETGRTVSDTSSVTTAIAGALAAMSWG